MRARVSKLVPLVGLLAMGVVVVRASQDAPALVADFGSPPEVRELPAPDLGLGEVTLEGTVFAADGRPSEGASVFVVQAGRPAWDFTDDLGRFRLTDLHPGALSVDVHAPGHVATSVSAQVGTGPLVVRLKEAIPAPPRLPDPTRVPLVGRIVPAEIDLTGFEVALLPTAPASEPGTGVPRRVACDAEGRFSAEDLVPAEYEVLLLPPWATGGSWPDLLTPLGAPALRIVHPPVGDLQLPLAAGLIAGTAFDGSRGEPLAGALVVAVPERGTDAGGPWHLPPTRTTPAGTYQLGPLPPGEYRVILTAGDESREAVVEVAPGGVSDPGF